MRTARSARFLCLAAGLIVPAIIAAQVPRRPPDVLPLAATVKLAESLDAARGHRHHVWRDTPPTNGGDLVNAYIEIPRGERRKFEYAMGANSRAIDRMIPEDVGPYPVNYGFVPQTISYDGDPFDVLVLGPPLPGGEVVPGAIVGLMYMEDEKVLDSKVVMSPVGPDQQPLYQLTAADRDRIGEYFRIYKRSEPEKFSKVPGWGSVAEGRDLVTMTHTFFRNCRMRAGESCRIGEKP